MEPLTAQDTAEIPRVNPITLGRFIADLRLPAVTVAQPVRVQKAAVDQLLRPVAPKHPGGQKRVRTGRPLTYDHPLWKLVGSATDAPPTDASKKYEYLADGHSTDQS